ncbi:MAG: dihydropteroate synthase [Paracoccaceae bacterium]
MSVYYRPIAQYGPERPAGALAIAGGWCWFERAELIRRDAENRLIPADQVPAEILHRITAPRAAISGLTMQRARLMGIVNVTPDSFSDGGQFGDADAAAAHALQMIRDGADIIDIGGESTRPGAQDVPHGLEISRTAPVIAAIRAHATVPISIDTRKSRVARAALDAGANLINDVSALSYDAQLAETTAKSGVPICLMHARGDPASMQDEPNYQNVLLDVCDHLSERIDAAIAAGIPRARIIVDPGIGFGKTLEHNLALLRGLSLLHTLGCPILLGVSRKRFIGTLSNQPDAQARLPGSIAAALAAIAQGVQIVRVHDIAQTRQALTIWAATTGLRHS